jgi:hypothetical protein
VPVLVLLDPGRVTPPASRRFGADPILDDHAKARYRHRLAELDGQIDRALEHNETIEPRSSIANGRLSSTSSAEPPASPADPAGSAMRANGHASR